MKYIKALLKFKGNTYWINLEGLYKKNGEIAIDVLENGKWRDIEKTELDLFDLMEQGVIIGTEKEPN